MLAPAVAAGKGVKGERKCRHCFRFLLVPPYGGTSQYRNHCCSAA